MPDTATTRPIPELRHAVLGAERCEGAARLQMLALVRQRAQAAEDLELLALLELHTQTELADALGITRQALHLRAKHARSRTAQSRRSAP